MFSIKSFSSHFRRVKWFWCRIEDFPDFYHLSGVNQNRRTTKVLSFEVRSIRVQRTIDCNQVERAKKRVLNFCTNVHVHLQIKWKMWNAEISLILWNRKIKGRKERKMQKSQLKKGDKKENGNASKKDSTLRWWVVRYMTEANHCLRENVCELVWIKVSRTNGKTWFLANARTCGRSLYAETFFFH